MRTHQIHFRVTEKEYAAIERAAKESKMSISEYLRAGIGIKRYKPSDDAAMKDLTKQLSRIGNNLNQLVVIERTVGADPDEILKTLKAIQSTRTEILKMLSDE